MRRVRSLGLLLLAAIAAAASVTSFDGATLAGELADAGAGRISVGGTVLALVDADRIVFADQPPPARPAGTFGVQLVDGSWLPATGLAVAAARDAVAVESALGRIELPLSAVAGWGDPELPPAGADDAVRVASGLLRGRVLGVRDGSLSFASSLDPEPLALPLAEVPALRLAARTPPPRGIRLRAILDPARPPLDLVLAGGHPALAAAPAVAVDPARLGSLPLRVEGGRRTYLSDLAPARVREDGAFGVVWPHVRDGAIGGGPLLLGGTRWAKGLTVHSAAELAWDLGGGAVRLRARVGIADQVAPEGDCVATLSGDGRSLWTARIRGGDRPRDLDLDVAGVRELILTVALGERHDIGDHLVLADAQLIGK